MTDTATFLADALREIEQVTTEAALMSWHDTYFTSMDYLHLTEGEARQLEAAYQNKAAWLWGVGA